MNLHKNRPSQKTNIFRQIDKTPSKYLGTLCPTNLDEEKERFLTYGLTPNFKMKCSRSELERISLTERGKIRFDLFKEAEHILKLVEDKFGDGDNYMDAAFGPYTDEKTAMKLMAQYLADCKCEDEIKVYWTKQLECSAKMMWRGPNIRRNRPEARRYTLLIKTTKENSLMRKMGILCLADHEIGTHYMRMINDGFQPWFSDRKRFGLRRLGCREQCATEEGLASINTVLHAKKGYLWSAALRYYTACMATRMKFDELYRHLEVYVRNAEQRWKLVMRVKRGLRDVNALGGCGNDQVYFEGAVDIIRHVDETDFIILYSGKICRDEVKRIHRVARLNSIKLPHFLKDMTKYKERVREIGVINGLISPTLNEPTTDVSRLGILKTNKTHFNKYNSPRDYSEDSWSRFAFDKCSSEESSDEDEAPDASLKENDPRKRFFEDTDFLRNSLNSLDSPRGQSRQSYSPEISTERPYLKKSNAQRRFSEELENAQQYLDDLDSSRKRLKSVMSVLPSVSLGRQKISPALLSRTSSPYLRQGTPPESVCMETSIQSLGRNCKSSCSDNDNTGGKKQKYWVRPKSTAVPRRSKVVKGSVTKKHKTKRRFCVQQNAHCEI